MQLKLQAFNKWTLSLSRPNFLIDFFRNMQNHPESHSLNQPLALIAFCVAAMHAAGLLFAAQYWDFTPVSKQPVKQERLVVKTIALNERPIQSKPAAAAIKQEEVIPVVSVEPIPEEKIEVIVKPKLEPLPEPLPEPEPIPESPKPEPKPEPVPVPKEVIKPAPIVEEKKPDPVAKPKPEVKPKEKKPEPKPAPKKEVKPTPKAKAKQPEKKISPPPPAPKPKVEAKEEAAKAKKREEDAAKARQKEAVLAKQKEAEKAKQRALAAARENMARIDKTRDKIQTSKTAELSGEKIGTIERLQVEAFIEEGGQTFTSQERSYHQELISRLKLQLKLPDYGDVKVKLTLERSGRVVKVAVVNAESAKNREYIEKKLPSMTYPSFGTNFPDHSQYTFVLILGNDL